MVVLVCGGNGQLGQALQSVAGQYPQIDFHFCSSSEMDITDKTAIEKAFEIKPDFCINAAAYTAVDKAESEPEKAHAINVDGVRNLAEVCKANETTLIHISTDFVFDGNANKPYSENDQTHPQGVYAKTKLDGENALKNAYDKYFIIRTAWVYSQFGNNFMKTMLRLASERDALNVVSDQIGTPTQAVDLAETIVKIIMSNSNNYGIYHFSNEGVASWYDFAAKIFQINNVHIDLKPIPTSGFPTPAKRPAYSVLDKTKIKNEFGLTINNWEQSLEQYK